LTVNNVTGAGIAVGERKQLNLLFGRPLRQQKVVITFDAATGIFPGWNLDKKADCTHCLSCVPSESSINRGAAAASGTKSPAPRPRINPGVFIRRTISWIVLWLGTLFLIYSGWRTVSLIGIAVIALAGQWEFYRAQEEKGHKVFKQSGLFCGALLFLASWYFLIHRPVDARFIHFGIELVLCFSLLGAFIRLVVWQEVHRAPITTAALTILGLMYVPFLFNFVALLAFMPGSPAENRFLLIYLLAVTKFSDVGAYVIGSLIGRHKMIPRISPGKTWEGFGGAILTSLVISIVLTYFMEGRAPSLSFTSSIVLGLLLPLISVVGDLAESVVKRDASIKDSGRTIPGIGGALDLIDSILFTAPVLYFYLQFTAPAP
jgi:phosphatidate cytidylyltransferase